MTAAPEISRLRRHALRLVIAATLAFAIGIVGQSVVPVPIWSAVFATLSEVSLALLVAGVLVVLFAADYHRDWASIPSLLGALWPYVTRTTTWGLAAAGVGALLATALPAQIANAISEPHAIPISGWMAIGFGGVGAAAAILHEWHLRTNAASALESDSSCDAPTASTNPTMAPDAQGPATRNS